MAKRPATALPKLTRPRLYEALPRQRLFASLDDRREHPVIWITGPPGSGKTTLAASYLEETSAPAVWYHLDKGDSDPAAFFFYLSQAVGAASRSRGPTLPLLTPEYLPDLEGFSRRFMRAAYQRLEQGSLLVLDNYHDVDPASVLHRMLNAAFAEIPQSANLVVISRSPPLPVFARAQVTGTLTTLGWDDLRLDPEETTAIVARRDVLDPKLVRAIHAKSGGWVAGVRLLVERADWSRGHEMIHRPEAMESVFDYFATEIYESSPKPLQNLLLRTAYLPRFTADMAAAISGDEQAGRLIEQMYKRRLFVDRRPGEVITYQYHDLFRAFLLSRARQTLPPGNLSLLIRTAANLLVSAHLPDEAFGLFVQATNWDEAERIFLEQAEVLIVRGRWQTLEEWGNSMPPHRRQANPWISYWLGRSKALVDPVAAFPILDAAYEAFVERKDGFGRLLCAATVVETLHFVIEHWDTMGVWLQRLKDALETSEVPISVDNELRVHVALFWAAENSDPTSPVVAPSVAKAVELLPRCLDVNLRISAANILHYHSVRALDSHASTVAAREARPHLDSPDLSADRHALYYLAEGFAHSDFAQFKDAFDCYDRADAIIEANGLVGRDHIAGVWRALSEYASGDLQGAQRTLARTEKLKAADLHVITQVLENARAWIAFGGGDIARALEHNGAAIRICETLGPYAVLSVLLPQRAYMLMATRQPKSAREPLERIRKEPGLIAYEHVGGAVAVLEAWEARLLGDESRCRVALQESLRLARDAHDRLRMRWYPLALSELLPLALEQDIEADVARLLIKEIGIAPPPGAPEVWPWPVRIRTLGRFEISVNENPLEFGRKSPKRTIALLKALIALGGKEVSEQRLADALWADLEGDAALESLSAALHRLRRLLGRNEAILQAGGLLSLNDRLCFVDAWKFELELDRPGRERVALNLYRGSFLNNEADAAWSTSMRERLRGKFVRAVASVGHELETAEKYRDAIDLYLRGIEADELVEPFYQGLMRCYHTLGRNGEAAAAFRRLRQALSVTLGASPSVDSQKLFQELRLQ